MELYKRIIEIVDSNLIYCLIPIILTLMIVELIFKKRFETKKVLNLIRWLIIVYAIITWSATLIGMTLYSEESVFNNPKTGSYKIGYWIMFLSALILPFTLLIKKLASKFWYVLLIAFCLKIGVYFENFVIITTSFNRDYLTEGENVEFMNSILLRIGMVFLQGITIVILTLSVFKMLKKRVQSSRKL